MTDLSHNFPKHERGPLRGRFKPPVGQLLTSFNQAAESGCIQAELEILREMFSVLMISTNLNPCDGCPEWERIGPKCETFRQRHTAYVTEGKKQEERIRQSTTPHNTGAGPLYGLTVKQIAEKLGISKNEVRRRKASGTL